MMPAGRRTRNIKGAMSHETVWIDQMERRFA
jgi:hypothetical protein